MKRKILFIGPIGDFGGRELETGFMASCLSEDFEIAILSTGNMTSNSQLFEFVSIDNVKILNKLIYQNNLWLRLLANLTALKTNKGNDKYALVSNSISKNMGYRIFAIKQLHKEINKADVIVLCMQLTSNYLKEIVEYTSTQGKPIVLRTSTTIKKADINFKNWLNKITLFLHHSLSNAKKLNHLSNYNYSIIDQCTYREKEMLSINPAQSLKSLLYVGRISEEKGILKFIELFQKLDSNLSLKIVGEGPQFEQLKVCTAFNENIELLGFLNQDEIVRQIEDVDAVIIPSYEESGPLVGLEAMASARLVITTEVGAMPERLKGLRNQFWFDVNNEDSFGKMVKQINSLSSKEIRKIAEKNRLRYIEKYQMDKIKSQYKSAIFKLSS